MTTDDDDDDNYDDSQASEHADEASLVGLLTHHPHSHTQSPFRIGALSADGNVRLLASLQSGEDPAK